MNIDKIKIKIRESGYCCDFYVNDKNSTPMFVIHGYASQNV